LLQIFGARRPAREKNSKKEEESRRKRQREGSTMSLAFDEYGRPFIVIKVSLRPWASRAASPEVPRLDRRSSCQTTRYVCFVRSPSEDLWGRSPAHRRLRLPRARARALVDGERREEFRADLDLPPPPNFSLVSDAEKQDAESKKRVKGLEAQKANILAARTVARILRSSLGPKGMDKMLQSPDGDLTISNDGATILEQMEVENQIGRLLVELSRSQDHEIGDGTTGVVVLAGALLEQAEVLLDRGMHPIRVAEGFEMAAKIAHTTLDTISEKFEFSADNLEPLVHTCMTTLSSKM